MLTFFATAKPFSGQNAIIQRNALESWKQLSPEVEVILFGDEPGAAEICGELGLRHEPQVKRHEGGMKYLNYMFERAQKIELASKRFAIPRTELGQLIVAEHEGPFLGLAEMAGAYSRHRRQSQPFGRLQPSVTA